MKKIGFVDYYISEWHADNYPAWIRNACQAEELEYELAYAWAERDISPYSGKSTDEWCAEFGTQRCATIDELCEKSDVIVILAPSDPEKHLGYAEQVFKWGKPTYVDKTFAPDVATAQKIFDLAAQYGTRFFSTSALRYADELAPFIGAKSICVKSGGGNMPEYIIHQVEMVVKTVGVGACAMTCTEENGEMRFAIEYPDDRRASMCYKAEYGTSLKRCEADEDVPVRSSFFDTLIRKILRFFETESIDFDGAETMEAMRLRESAIKAAEKPGCKVAVG